MNPFPHWATESFDLKAQPLSALVPNLVGEEPADALACKEVFDPAMTSYVRRAGKGVCSPHVG